MSNPMTTGPFTAGQLVFWRPEGRKRDPIAATVLRPSATAKRIKIEYEYNTTSGPRKHWTYVAATNLEPRP
jgi:hypothetical protein